MTTGSTRHFRGIFDPLATYARLRAADQLGTYSYLHIAPDRAEIGWAPLERLRLLDGQVAVDWRSRLERLSESAARSQRAAFGYIAFDAFDSVVGALPDGSATGLPLIEFIVPGEVLSFTGDRVVHQTQWGLDMSRYLNVRDPPRQPQVAAPRFEPVSQTPDATFMSAVAKATSALAAGEAQKCVLSRYQAFDVEFDPVVLFAALCLSRPFVDAFLLSFGDVTAIVASPELLLSATKGLITTNPLAGTRPRGATLAEDQRLRAELRGDHKEIVEHVVSVTNLLSELEPMCEPESLVVKRLLDVSLQQRVQHLSSVIEGRLLPERHALDALWTIFPSVTVCGLPKAQSLAIIRRLEPHPRLLYSGTMGWVSGREDARFSLSIRGIFKYGRRTFIQAGAGIMVESKPENELHETTHKLASMKEALAWSLGMRS